MVPRVATSAAFFRVEGTLLSRGAVSLAAYCAANQARFGDRTLRLLYDATESGLRLEVEGHTHFFAGQTAGQVRAGTPAMVVAIHVRPGEWVEVGQPLGVLEAMKMESLRRARRGVVRKCSRSAGAEWPPARCCW
jgi:biotin carboxyl carrier protein